MSIAIYLTPFIIVADIVLFFVLRKKMGFKKGFFIAGGALAIYMVLFFISLAFLL
jgi:hypothetical protein